MACGVSPRFSYGYSCLGARVLIQGFCAGGGDVEPVEDEPEPFPAFPLPVLPVPVFPLPVLPVPVFPPLPVLPVPVFPPLPVPVFPPRVPITGAGSVTTGHAIRQGSCQGNVTRLAKRRDRSPPCSDELPGGRSEYDGLG